VLHVLSDAEITLIEMSACQLHLTETADTKHANGLFGATIANQLPAYRQGESETSSVDLMINTSPIMQLQNSAVCLLRRYRSVVPL